MTAAPVAAPEEAAPPARWHRLLRWRDASPPPALLAVAAVVFVAATVVAFRQLPPGDPSWGWLAVVAIVGTPLTVALNAAEYSLSGRLARVRVPVGAALRTSLLASAANLLPLPGSAIVRADALRRLGTTGRRAVWVTAVAGALWLAGTAVVGGLLLVGSGDGASIGVPLLGGGVAAGLVAWVLAARLGGGVPPGPLAALVGVELAAALLAGVRLLLAARALGHELDLAEAVTLTLSIVIASAAGVLPGGLGLRELLAGGLAPVLGVAAAVAVAGTAAVRLADLVVLAPVSVWLAVRGMRAGVAST